MTWTLSKGHRKFSDKAKFFSLSVLITIIQDFFFFFFFFFEGKGGYVCMKFGCLNILAAVTKIAS